MALLQLPVILLLEAEEAAEETGKEGANTGFARLHTGAALLGSLTVTRPTTDLRGDASVDKADAEEGEETKGKCCHDEGQDKGFVRGWLKGIKVS
jgi:hypothetical protein